MKILKHLSYERKVARLMTFSKLFKLLNLLKLHDPIKTNDMPFCTTALMEEFQHISKATLLNSR